MDLPHMLRQVRLILIRHQKTLLNEWKRICSWRMRQQKPYDLLRMRLGKLMQRILRLMLRLSTRPWRASLMVKENEEAVMPPIIA